MNIFKSFIEKRRLKKELKEVLNYLNKIPAINNGGCGVSALTIHTWLKRKGKKSEIAYIYTDSDEFETNINNKMNNQRLTVPNHVVVHYNNSLIDSNGEYYIGIHNRRCLYATKKDLRKTLKLKADWNAQFDRKHVKTIEKKFDMSLNIN